MIKSLKKTAVHLVFDRDKMGGTVTLPPNPSSIQSVSEDAAES